MTSSGIRDQIFNAARYWRMNPYDVEKLSIPDFLELIDQANRINEDEEEKWRRSHPKLTR